MTPTANRRHHTSNLVHGKLAVDEASDHDITRFGKHSVNIIQTAINIASRRSPNIRHNFVGRTLSHLRGSQLLQNMLSYSLLICFLFWDSSIGQFVADTSILVTQREGVVNFRVFVDVKK